eukprot:2712006-Pyramimonas_sp.AAC.1
MLWDVPSAANSETKTRRKTTPNTLTRRSTFGAGAHDGSEAHGQSNAVGGPLASSTSSTYGGTFAPDGRRSERARLLQPAA